MDWPLILFATGASAAAGLATGVGALLIYAVSTDRLARIEHPALGFTAGVMLAASFFSLILPGIESAEAVGIPGALAAAIVIGALLIGAATIYLMKRYSPPFERMLLNPAEVDPERARSIWIFIAAIVLHNLPEGLAIGVSFGGGNIDNGTATAIGIGLQNVPEGLAVALLVLSLGYRRSTAFRTSTVSGRSWSVRSAAWTPPLNWPGYPFRHPLLFRAAVRRTLAKRLDRNAVIATDLSRLGGVQLRGGRISLAPTQWNGRSRHIRIAGTSVA